MDTLDDWDSIANRLVLITSAGQLGSAKSATEYVQSNVGQAAGTLDPRMLSGVATDVDNLVYQPLDSYLYGSVAYARGFYGSGMTDTEVMAAGENRLRILVRSQVADAARNAIGTLIAATPKARWYRVIAPPCCQRCAVFAGEEFAWSSSFRRHPRCDCLQGPILSDDKSKITAGVDVDDITDLTKAQRRAIKDGADINQVINAKRAGQVKKIKIGGETVTVTTEGTTKRGWYTYVQREIAAQKGEALVEWDVTRVDKARGAVKNYTVSRLKPRLTPEAIYQFSTSREEAVRLLARNGYLSDLKESARLALAIT